MEKNLVIFVVVIVCVVLFLSSAVGAFVTLYEKEVPVVTPGSTRPTRPPKPTTLPPIPTSDILGELKRLPSESIENIVFKTEFKNSVTPVMVLHISTYPSLLVKLSDKISSSTVKELHATRWTFKDKSLYGHSVNIDGNKLDGQSILYKDNNKLTTMSTKGRDIREIPRLNLELLLRSSNNKYYIRDKDTGEYLVGNGEQLFFSKNVAAAGNQLFSFIEGTVIDPVEIVHQKVDLKSDSNAETVEKNGKTYTQVTKNTFGKKYLLRHEKDTKACYYVFRGRFGSNDSCTDTDFYKMSFVESNGKLKLKVPEMNRGPWFLTRNLELSKTDDGTTFDVYNGPDKEFIIRIKGTDSYMNLAKRGQVSRVTANTTASDIWFEALV
jgi:hypothetical protein